MFKSILVIFVAFVFAAAMPRAGMAADDDKETDIFKSIKKDHKEVMEIMDEIQKEDDAGDRAEEMAKLKKELVPHMRAEEKVFYPALQSKQDAAKAQQEHKAAEMLFGKLEKMPKKEGKEFNEKFMRFKEAIKAHVKLEEGKIFDDSKKAFNKEQVIDLDNRFMQEKMNIKRSMTGREGATTNF